MVTTGGIYKIAYAMPNDGGTVSVKEICNIGNGAPVSYTHLTLPTICTV